MLTVTVTDLNDGLAHLLGPEQSGHLLYAAFLTLPVRRNLPHSVLPPSITGSNTSGWQHLLPGLSYLLNKIACFLKDEEKLSSLLGPHHLLSQ